MRKTYLTVLLVVALVPMISNSYALQEVAGKIILNLSAGQTQRFNWELVSDSSNSTTVALSASGNGSEMLSFPKTVTLQPHQMVTISVTSSVPPYYSGPSQLTTFLFATQKCQAGGPTILNVQVMKIVTMNINGTSHTPPTTNAVPEFQFAMPILVLSIASFIVIYRLKFSGMRFKV